MTQKLLLIKTEKNMLHIYFHVFMIIISINFIDSNNSQIIEMIPVIYFSTVIFLF